MGRRGLGLILMLSYHLYVAMAAPSALQQASPADHHYQEADPTERWGKNGVTNQFDTRYTASLISHAGLGHGSANGGGDHGGGNRSPSGGAAIPVYAAGSARRRQGPHRNAGSSNENSIGLLAAAWASIMFRYYG